MNIKSDKLTCKHCGKGIILREQFFQEKETEITLTCPWCSEVIGSYTPYRNKLFVVEKDNSHH